MYSMYSIRNDSIALARSVKNFSDLLVVGGPLPALNPVSFLNDFDIVVIGEGERTMLDIARNFLNGEDILGVDGVAFKENDELRFSPKRKEIENLDSIPFPARELFDNEAYKQYYKRLFGYSMTSIISSRGCHFDCDFCSRPIFKNSCRLRSPNNVVDEMESVLKFGYDFVWFADDCFTIYKDRIIKICDEIISRDLGIKWQCLSRVDTLDSEMAARMKEAGCQRIYFGIESGDDRILRIVMNKGNDVQAANEAVHIAKNSKIEAGGFFIVGYPGENNETILNTIKFATSLPLDYASFTLPYPIPGTGLYEKVKQTGVFEEPSEKKISFIDQNLLFRSDFSEFKLKFAILKAATQFRIKRHLGIRGYKLLGGPFEKITDTTFRVLR